jgi:hypothetical protein
MFKVVCINDSHFGPNAPIKVGDEFTVLEAGPSYIDGIPVYFFMEYGSRHEFFQSFFAQLDSDIDETTLVNSKPELETA